MVRIGIGGFLSGAFSVMDHTIRIMVTIMRPGIQCLRSRNGQTYFLHPGEGPRFAVMRLRERRIAGELFDQDVVRVRLLPGQVHVESQQRNHGDDRNVVRGGEDFPKLLPIHGYFFASFISESSTTAAGPEMPPSFLTRQKCRIAKIEA